MSSSLQSNLKQTSGALFNTHATPKKIINGGAPCLIITTNADYSKSGTRSAGDKLYHVMMAYGYSGDKFLVNMGWASSDSTQTIVSNATIHSYYTLEYTGDHVHSFRIKGKTLKLGSIASREYMSCACGQVLDINGGIIK